MTSPHVPQAPGYLRGDPASAPATDTQVGDGSKADWARPPPSRLSQAGSIRGGIGISGWPVIWATTILNRSPSGPSGTGRLVEFADAMTEPSLRIRKIRLSGGGAGERFDGQIRDIAAPASAWPEPVRIRAKGSQSHEGQPSNFEHPLDRLLGRGHLVTLGWHILAVT